MPTLHASPRWLVPVAVGGLIGAGSLVSSAVAGSAPSLPHRTPAQVLASVAAARVTALSGTVSTNADLGLPNLSGLGTAAGGGHGDRRTNPATEPQALLTRFLSGKNTLRVWLNGPTQARAQLLDPLAELDVVRNGQQVWTYDSGLNQVTHAVLPARPSGAEKTRPAPGTASPQGSATGSGGTQGSLPVAASPQNLTPQALADRALAALDPSTSVTLGTPAVVAGRDTYTLVLTPKTSATLVRDVQISVDAANGVPLQVQVYARGQAAPALESGFTSVSYARPPASEFSFTVPKGASVRQQTLPGADQDSVKPTTPNGRQGPKPTVHGTGWATIVELPAGTLNTALSAPAARPATPSGAPSAVPSGSAPPPSVAQAQAQAQVNQVLQQLTTPVAGGRALHTALFSVLITTDGRVFAGAVPVSALQAAAR